MTEILQGFYFVWIKLINGVALAAIYGIIPALTVLFTIGAWPYERDRFVKPGPFKAILIACIVFLGVISYGAQLNFIFNRQPTPLMDELRANFYQSFQEHLSEQALKKPVVRTNLKTEIRRYELVSYDPPKHFYVTLEDVQTHQVFNKLYVSKHCNSASSNKRGDEYNIQVTTYALSDKPGVMFFDFHNLYDVFCK